VAGVRFEEVSKVYSDGTRAVSELNLEVHDGEFVVLVGPSGCGKTTALRMVAGLEEISEGTIRIGEAVVNRLPPPKRDVAMVFQNYALYPQMTVYDNIGFGLKMRSIPKTCWAASPEFSRAGSDSGSRWGAQSCVTLRSS
jgi:multiple sugar transport system ATP-binding protein